MTEGELVDASEGESEFFVVEDRTVGGENLYASRYHLKCDMLLPGIGEKLARKVLGVGRGINFLKKCCGGGDGVARDLDSVRNIFKGQGEAFKHGNTALLENLIDSALASVSTSVVASLKTTYHLLAHLSALKKFLFLGQGDFVSALLDAVGQELSKRADRVYRHNLLGVLDAALRSTNAQYLPSYILDKCGVRLYEPSPGDSGWDVFSLDYHIESPLTAVVGSDAKVKYKRIFHLLWRLRSIEWGLNNTWRRATSVNHALRAGGRGRTGSIAKALRKVALARQEMLHVTSNIQNYLMFEVLEGSWNKFKERLDGAANLDEIIQAHDLYLDNIIELALLTEDKESREIQQLLRGLLDVTERFCSVQDRVFVDCLSALGWGAGGEVQSRIRRGQWGSEGGGGGDGGGGGGGGGEDMEGFGLRSLEGVTAACQDFHSGLDALLAKLGQGGGDGLRFLIFRLDFNQFYRTKFGEEGAKGGRV